jgi:hypothetical protein
MGPALYRAGLRRAGLRRAGAAPSRRPVLGSRSMCSRAPTWLLCILLAGFACCDEQDDREPGGTSASRGATGKSDPSAREGNGSSPGQPEQPAAPAAPSTDPAPAKPSDPSPDDSQEPGAEATPDDAEGPVQPVESGFVEDPQWTHEKYDYAGKTLVVLSGFVRPYGLTPTADGKLYVADLKEGRVIRFDSQLRATGWLGAQADDNADISGWHLSGKPVVGSAPGMFSMAHSVAFDRDGRVYIGDYGNGRVPIYEPNGKFVGHLFEPPATPEVAFKGTPFAELDRNANLWVADFDGHRVFKFGADLGFIGWLGARADGTVVNGFARDGAAVEGRAPGALTRPHMVQVDAAGFFYIVESGNHRVQKFQADGKVVGWIGGKSDGSVTDGWETGSVSAATAEPGGFNAPVSLRLVDDAYFLITDNGNHRIQKFSLDGRFLGWLGGKSDGSPTQGWATSGSSAKGTAPGTFSAPYDARYRDGKLFVADGHNARVQIIELPD